MINKIFFKTNRQDLLQIFILSLIFFGITAVFAKSSGGGMPFDDFIDKLLASIQGPYAYGATIIGMIACASGLLFGGELSQFIKTCLYLILIGAFMLFCTQLITGFFGVSSTLKEYLDPADLEEAIALLRS